MIPAQNKEMDRETFKKRLILESGYREDSKHFQTLFNDFLINKLSFYVKKAEVSETLILKEINRSNFIMSRIANSIKEEK